MTIDHLDFALIFYGIGTYITIRIAMPTSSQDILDIENILAPEGWTLMGWSYSDLEAVDNLFAN